MARRNVLQKRMNILRNYLATTVLSPREKAAVENYVRELEASLSESSWVIREEALSIGGRTLSPASAANGSESAMKAGNNTAFKSAVLQQDDKKDEKAEAEKEEADEAQDAAQSGTKKEETRFFDTRRFSLSGGVVVSQLERREYQQVLGIARDASGMPTDGDTLTTVIGLKEDNDWTIGPVLLLNTRVWERADRNFGLHGSVGITGKRDDKGTDIDYFFGPSVSFLRGLVFFSSGFYVGKQQRLAGDAYLSAKIDKDASVPVVKEYHAKPGFSLTFRIFPLPE